MQTPNFALFIALAALVAVSSGMYERYARPCRADHTLISVGR